MKLAISATLLISRLFAAILFLTTTSCVVAPYPVSPDVTFNDQVEISDDIILTLGPRELLEKISTKITSSYENIEIIDGLSFLETAFPDGEWKLGKLLEPDTCSRVKKQLDVAFLVIVGPEEYFHSEEGYTSILPPILGVGSEEKVSKISSVIIDMRRGEIVCQISSEAHGKDRYVHYVVVAVGTIALTKSSAITGLAKETGRVIDKLTESEKTRIALIAVESTFREYQEK